MSGKPEQYRDLPSLIAGLLDKRLTPEERARLELILDADPAARRVYFQMVDQEIELECLLVPDRTATAIPLLDAAPERERAAPQRAAWWRLFAAAAVAAFLAAAWWRETTWSRPEPSRELPGARQLSVAAGAGDWGEDFENSTARGWVGEMVSAGLPAGSRQAIRAVRHAGTDGVYYQIAPPADWSDGLVALTSRSTLHVTYRMGDTTWVNVFMHALPAEGGGTQPAMFQLSGSAFPGAAGQWQTASIPFSLFQRKIFDAAQGGVAFTGGAPREGERIAALIFSAPHAIDLTIDRIWITPDGTLTETIRPHP